MEIPRFDYSEPLGSIFKIRHSFNLHNMLDERRISNSSLYMDGPALD